MKFGPQMEQSNIGKNTVKKGQNSMWSNNESTTKE